MLIRDEVNQHLAAPVSLESPMNVRAHRLLASLLVATATWFAASSVDARTSSRQFLETQLSTSRDFRNRVQAALALGRLGESASRVVLERALASDDNEAVRAAAAAALGELGDRRSIPALTRAQRDRSEAVRRQAATSLQTIRGESGEGGQDVEDWRQVRYVVVIGSVRNNAGFGGTDLATRLRAAVLQHLQAISGVVPFAADAEMGETVRREIERRRLPVFRVDATLDEVERARQGTDTRVRSTVNLVLTDDHTSSVRGVLSGSASATERTNSDRRQTLRMAGASMDAAVRGALTSASSAFQQATRAARR